MNIKQFKFLKDSPVLNLMINMIKNNFKTNNNNLKNKQKKKIK